MANSLASVWTQTVWLQPGLSTHTPHLASSPSFLRSLLLHLSTQSKHSFSKLTISGPIRKRCCFINRNACFLISPQFKIQLYQIMLKCQLSCWLYMQFYTSYSNFLSLLTHLKMLSHWAVEGIPEQTKCLVQSPPGSWDCRGSLTARFLTPHKSFTSVRYSRGQVHLCTHVSSHPKGSDYSDGSYHFV